tara:strand:+ start:931 stop:1251 length:321 start_codon:yes stop_codon:yes gene_type:complete
MVMGPKTTMALQRYTEVADGMGGSTFTYQAKRKIKGVLTPLLGNERMITGKEEVFADFRFTIDYQKGLTITGKDRFILKARKFDIVLIGNPAQQDIHLEIKLLEVA